MQNQLNIKEPHFIGLYFKAIVETERFIILQSKSAFGWTLRLFSFLKLCIQMFNWQK